MDDPLSTYGTANAPTPATRARPAPRGAVEARPRRASTSSPLTDSPGFTSRPPGAARARRAGRALRLPRARRRGRPLEAPAAEGRRVPELPLRRPPLPVLRQDGPAAERGRARRLPRPGLPDHASERRAASRLAALHALRERRGAARRALLEGLGLPALPRPRRPLRLLLPDPRQDRAQARLDRGRAIFEGRSEDVVRDISNAKQEIIAYRKIIKPERATLRLLERYIAALPRPRISRSTSTTSSTPPSGSGTCSTTTRRSSRASSRRTSRSSTTSRTTSSSSSRWSASSCCRSR